MESNISSVDTKWWILWVLLSYAAIAGTDLFRIAGYSLRELRLLEAPHEVIAGRTKYSLTNSLYPKLSGQ